MGECKDTTDNIYDKLISVLEEKGYEDIQSDTKLNNKIVDLINPNQDVQENFDDLVSEAIEVINEYEEEEEDTMIEWFKSEYKDPANGVPHDSEEGYIYNNGGPYDPLEELQENFPNYRERAVNNAAEKLYTEGSEWVKIDEY